MSPAWRCRQPERCSAHEDLCGAQDYAELATRLLLSSPHRVEVTPHIFGRGRPAATLPKACPAPGSGQA